MSLESTIRKVLSAKDNLQEGDATKAASEKIKREKESDKRKHDTMMDRARSLDTRNKNNQTEEMDPTKHVMKNKDTGKYCVYNANNKKVAEFDSEDEANAYAKKNHDKLMQKEAVSPAQQAAIAISKKEKGEKPKNEELDDNDKPVVKKVVKMLKKASKAHAGQADDLEKSMSEDYLDDTLDNFFELEEDAKMGKQSDSNLKSLMKKFKNMPKSPANDHMLKRIEKEMKKRNLDEGYEAKVSKILNKKGIDHHWKNGKVYVAKKDVKAAEKKLKKKAGPGLGTAVRMIPDIIGEEVQFDLHIQEGVWHYPDARQVAKFKKALGKKFIVGKDGYPAKDIIPFGDDELYDMLDDAADVNPKQDARPIFTRWINGRIRDNYGGYGKKTLAIAKQLGIREEVEMNENSDAKRYGLSQSLVDAVASIIAGKKPTNAKEDNTNDKSDDGEGLDKVQPKALKKKFKDRKDKDIDNDGDVDSSDKYMHKKRQAVSKAIAKDDEKSAPKDDADTKADPKKKKKGNGEPVDTKPTMNAESVQKEEMTDAQMKKREEIVKELKKKSDYFKDKYGEKADDVMYATATKMAMK